ncbi:hypothetical protein PENDEC_c006G01299 [Penicillium decumbens]|uniref:Uncharacterized protein n=1 Tax=Penicillium decumbens TaxID=69771 RepID=A0A1V6PFJ0_PENDC|nr:hypothetical protein PENDEC_c006G01299 [Penicillium decumbens]
MAGQEHPPPYYTSLEYAMNEKSDTDFVLPPYPNECGFATSSTSKGLQVPSRTSACSSGFDYPNELTRYGISQEHWSQFTRAIQDKAKLSRRQWTIVIGKGLGALAIGGFMIGFLGAFPALLVTRRARERQEKRNLIAAMAGVRREHLSCYIEHWNKAFFRPRGVLIRVDLPDGYLDDIRDMDIHRSASSLLSDERAREKAALKARIVVIPLEETPVASSTSMMGTERDWYT